MTQITMSLADTLALVKRLQFKGYHVLSFGHDGFSCEDNGTQIFRATLQGGDRFLIRYDRELLSNAEV